MEKNANLTKKPPVYSVEIKKTIENKKGWDSYLVSVLKDGEEIGTYERNYSIVKGTFFPFCQDNEWYALYSKDYTATRVMKLPECKDLGGEERDSFGFCPVEYYVPFGPDIETDDPDLDGKIGFIAGCVWGDDSYWKLRVVDLSDIKNGNLKIDERFGYHILPDLPLKDCINLRLYDIGRIEILTPMTYSLHEPEKNDVFPGFDEKFVDCFYSRKRRNNGKKKEKDFIS